MENKYLQKVPPVVDPRKLLSELQQVWLRRRHAEGRSVGVLIGSVDGHLFYPSCSWDSDTPLKRTDFQARLTKTPVIAEQLIEIVGEIDPSLWAGIVK